MGEKLLSPDVKMSSKKWAFLLFFDMSMLTLLSSTYFGKTKISFTGSSVRGRIFSGNLTLIGTKPSSQQFLKILASIVALINV
jgi:hypothetical protein